MKDKQIDVRKRRLPQTRFVKMSFFLIESRERFGYLLAGAELRKIFENLVNE